MLNKLFHGRRTFSQYGEDLIIEGIFKKGRIDYPLIKYIDVGAFHPYKLSNTALFYRYGSSEVNIEANPDLIPAFRKHRKRDITLNVAVDVKHRDRIFGINTENPEMFSSLIVHGGQRKKVVVKCVTLQFLFEKYFVPDFLNLDIEGLDEDVLLSMKDKPTVICVETGVHWTLGGGKNNNIVDHLKTMGYEEYAYTGLNSIMVLLKDVT